MTAVERQEGESRSARLALAFLLFSTLAIYGRTAFHPFVSYDDPVYVSENPVVARGLTLEGLRWAFGARAGNWHPLTWLAHMLDCQLFGLRAGAHHLVNAALHALNAALLWAALLRLTRASWTSLFVAALFALHPLRVESVAWASERKDVLAGTFWMLALLAYERWARRGGAGRYLVVALCLALGLMAKSMLVTLPCVFLLLDHWPLGRSRTTTAAPALPSLAPTHPGKTPGTRAGFGLIAEKIPLLALALAAGAATFAIQRSAGAVGTASSLSLPARAANAALSCWIYVGQTLWPSGLACIVPHPAVTRADLGRELWIPGLASLAGLVVASGLAFALRRRAPWLLVGWAWYLVTLLPVIGLVQVGVQAHADRYTYLPSIGLYLMAGFSLRALVLRRPALRPGAVGAAALALVLLAALAWRQVGFWKDSRTLFEHALAVTEDNWVAETYLGKVERRAGDPASARARFERALAANPRHVEAMLELGYACEALGDRPAAHRAFQRVLRNDPANPRAHEALERLERPPPIGRD